tara:strand:+ start:1415 stop:2719 length:1305 start_codon:yes stop_codon:yes gene_type:complete
MGLKRNQQQVRKKALIITYYWPPAGGPGVQRWLKFVKYLPEYNIDPIVFIPDNPNYPMTDESLLDEVSSEVKIVRFPISEPYKLASLFSKNKSKVLSKGIISEKETQSLLEKLLLYIRGNFFIPDARIAWVKPSVTFLSEFISTENIETIITTGPPHSLHLIGLQLKERLGVKWLADFRDPWTSIGYHKQLKLTKKSQLKHKFLEQQVLDHADQIIVTSFTTKKEFEGLTKQPVHVITNGYDMMSTAKSNLDKKFSISHIGSLLSKRNPDVLWRVFHDLINENKGFSKDFQLNLIGVVSDNVMKNIQNYNITDYVNKVGYVSHKEAITYQKKSQVLLLIEIDSDETKGIIPGKLFEYMVSNRPIIAIGPADSDVETIIKETNSGSYFNYNDYDSLKTLILNQYDAFKNGTLQSHPIGLQKYSRKELTKALSNLI